MDDKPRNADTWLWLTAPIAVLMAIASASGLFIPDLYRDAPSLVAQAIGQDAITLAVALPVLVVTAIFTGRGSKRARLIWLGMLVYAAYTYASYAFGIRFNPLFLIYVALLGCSTYALIGALATTDLAGMKAAFTERTPVRSVSIFLLVVAALFYLMWLSEAIPASLTGIPPESVQEDGTPTNVIHVLDMAWLLPAVIIAAVNLWRKRPLGYTLAPALLANLVFLPLAILSMILFQARGGEPVALPLVMIFLALFGVSLGMLIWVLKKLRS
jgi:hypothetical protein